MMLEDEGGGVTKAYAKFSPDRKHANILLSNNDLTAQNTATNAYNTVYVDIDKSSGLWAIEWLVTGSTSNIQLMTGVSDTLNTGGYLTNSVDTTAMISLNGNLYINAVSSAGYFDALAYQGVKEIMVIDADRKTIAMRKNGVLEESSINSDLAKLTIGFTLYRYQVQYAQALTINTGQSPFTAGNEDLISAYETTNGVTINRGLWA